MESISKKTGKRFTGKFAELAARIGIATTADIGEKPAKKAVKKPAKKRRK